MTGAVSVHSGQNRGSGDGISPFVPEWVVLLQSQGTGRPVFVFPSAHSERGSLIIEGRMTAHVGRDHPFWGFGLDAAHRGLVAADGVAALGAEYVAQMQAIQGKGPFLLYGVCLGGYLAWETARQLVAAGEEVGGMLFYEVPLRSDFAKVRPGPMPVDSPHQWRLAHYYRVQPLPVDLTHVMTAGWHASKWWQPWQQVALGSAETVVVPGETETAFVHREERIARLVRDWIDTSKRRGRQR